MIMTRVFHITTVHHFPDVRIFLKQCASLHRAGYEVTVLACCGRSLFKFKGYSVICIGKSTRNRLRRLVPQLSILKKILMERPDIVHFHDPELLPLMCILAGCGGRRMRVIFDVHEDYASPLFNNWKRLLLGKVYHHLLPVAENRMSFILAEDSYNRFCQRFHTVIHNYPLKIEDIPWEEREKRVVYLGTITEQRGALNMIRGFAAAQIDGWELIIIGSFDKPELLKCMKKVAMNLGIEKHVRILDYMPMEHALDFIKRSRIGLVLLHPIPNYVHSLPTKVFEYLSAGLLIVISDFPFYKKFFQKIPGIVFVDPMDIKAIGDEIRRLSDYEDSENAILQGRQLVKDMFSWESEEKKLLGVYERLLDNPAGHLL